MKRDNKIKSIVNDLDKVGIKKNIFSSILLIYKEYCFVYWSSTFYVGFQTWQLKFITVILSIICILTIVIYLLWDIWTLTIFILFYFIFLILLFFSFIFFWRTMKKARDLEVMWNSLERSGRTNGLEGSGRV